MSRRLTIITVIALMILLSLTLAACEKERPVPTPSRSTPQTARGTVAVTTGTPSTPSAALTTGDCPRGGRHPDCASDADSGRWGHVDHSHRPAAGGGQHQRRERDRPVLRLYRCRRGHPGSDRQPVQHDPRGDHPAQRPEGCQRAGAGSTAQDPRQSVFRGHGSHQRRRDDRHRWGHQHIYCAGR